MGPYLVGERYRRTRVPGRVQEDIVRDHVLRGLVLSVALGLHGGGGGRHVGEEKIEKGRKGEEVRGAAR